MTDKNILLQMHRNLTGIGISKRLTTYAATEAQDIPNLNASEKFLLTSHSLAAAAWDVHQKPFKNKMDAAVNFVEMMQNIMEKSLEAET